MQLVKGSPDAVIAPKSQLDPDPAFYLYPISQSVSQSITLPYRYKVKHIV